MKGVTAAVLSLALGGCTTVKLAQRDGCWVRRTEGFLRGTKEELGPCATPQPPWVEDGLARMVQECQARADYRWHGRALAAWSREERLPDERAETAVLQECMGQAMRETVARNDSLKAQLAEMGAERDAAKRRAAEEHDKLQAALDGERKRSESVMDAERAHLHSTNEKLAAYLGEAAKKAQAPAHATATATSEGRARMDQASSSRAVPASAAVRSHPAAAPACTPEAKARPVPARAEVAEERTAAPAPEHGR